MKSLLFALALLAPPSTPPRELTAPSEAEIQAVYPPDAFAAGTRGGVVLKCQVETSGQPSFCQVEREFPAGLGFGEAALGLAAKYQFTPALADERVVRSETTVTIAFKPPEPSFLQANGRNIAVGAFWILLIGAGLFFWRRQGKK